MKRQITNPFSSMILRIIGFVILCYSGAVAQNAPITLAPQMLADSGNSIIIPVHVTNFNNIGAVSLELNFDPAVLTYLSSTSNGGFPGLSFGNAIPGSLLVAGFTSAGNGISLADNTVLFSLTFVYSGGSTGLNWLDNGTSCEYAGSAPLYETLNDIPQSTYYIDGSVSGFPLPGDAGSITGPSNGMVCAGQNGIVFAIAPIPDATGYSWSLPLGATVTSGENTPQITVSFAPDAEDGIVEVHGINQNGAGTSSPPFPITINALPEITVQPVSPEPVFAGSGMATFQVTATGSDLNYQWQEFQTTWLDISDGGVYAGTTAETLALTNPPLSMNGYLYRCIVDGFCEPQVITDGNAMLTVNEFPLPGGAGPIAGPANGMVCAGETGVAFGVAPIPGATGYLWTLPLGASITAGLNTNEILVSFGSGAVNGPVTVTGTNSYGSGPVSAPFQLTILAPPAIVSQPVSPEPVFAGSGTAIFSVTASGSLLTYQWQEFQAGWTTISEGGVYSGSATDSLVVSNPPVSFNGNRYRCVVSGSCAPQAITNGEAMLTVNLVTGTSQPSPVGNTPWQCTVYPNPCSSQATLCFELPEESLILLQIADLSGNIVQYPVPIYGQKGLNHFTVETNKLQPGIYTVLMYSKMINTDVLHTVKLAIQP